ncbi:AraC family ligand binding domain-containing protein [Staphylococcus equorum]
MQVLWKKFSKKLIDANLVECGIEVGVPNVGYNYTVFQTSVIHIVTHGEGIFKYNGESFNLKKGDMFLLEKGMEVEYKPSFSKPWTYYWVGISGKQILDYLARSYIVDDHVIKGKDTSEIKKTIQNICNLSKTIASSNSHDILIMQHIYQLVYMLQEQFLKISQLTSILLTKISKKQSNLSIQTITRILVSLMLRNMLMSLAVIYSSCLKRI